MAKKPPKPSVLSLRAPLLTEFYFALLLLRKQRTTAAPISEDTGDEENGRGTAFRTKTKSGIDGWSKAAPDYEENPALSAAQLERRKRLQQRHDFECIWTRNS